MNRSLESVIWRHGSSSRFVSRRGHLPSGEVQPGARGSRCTYEGSAHLLEPSQFIPVHTSGVDMALLVLEGDGQIVAGDVQEAIHPGAVVFVPAREARRVKAETRLVALHLVSPPPTEKDHFEVMAKLKQGNWQ